MSHSAAFSFSALRQQACAALCLASCLAASAGEAATQADAGRVPMPVIEAARGGQCVGDPAYMRRNHMVLLKHQRSDTLRDGIRTGKYSLKECIACHASQTTNSVNASDTNFCQSCHSYAAVSLDCFGCHASRPAHSPSPSHLTQSQALLTPPQVKP